MIIFAIAVVFAIGGALLYISIGNSSPTTPQGVKVAELARITYAAAMFAIMFALTLGLHEELVRVVK